MKTMTTMTLAMAGLLLACSDGGGPHTEGLPRGHSDTDSGLAMSDLVGTETETGDTDADSASDSDSDSGDDCEDTEALRCPPERASGAT